MANTLFKNLIERYLQDRKEHMENTAFYIANGFYPSWNEEYRNDTDRGLKEYSTGTRWSQYTNGEITREKAVELAIKRMTKAEQKKVFEKLAYLDRVAAAPDFTIGTVYVEFKKSATWGYNPTAEFYAGYSHTVGTASGCGYDKESAAIAEALNANLSIMKALYSLKEKALAAGMSDESKTACTGVNNEKILGYGAGYSVIPYFEGGVGVRCFWSILEKAGISTEEFYGKRENTYKLTAGQILKA